MTEKVKLAKAREARGSIYTSLKNTMGDVWSPTLVDKLSSDDHGKYERVVKDCRFFFRYDPLASTVISKMVDLAINSLVIDAPGATVTEGQIFNAVKEDLINLLRRASYEYLITGLVIPEISFTRMRKTDLRNLGIQRLDSLVYPTSMWMRDSAQIEIKRPLITEKESYFVKIDDEIIFFIQNKGVYADGSEDKALYNDIVRRYPEFVRAILNQEQKVLLVNPVVIKATSLEDSQYPIPYLFPALEALKHKRNIRRVDYSIAARIISAILHVKVGSDEFPLTEDEEDVLDDLDNKLKWRGGVGIDEIERVFVLLTNHTVDLEWVFPEVSVLLDEKKYVSVNQDIMVALGFPRILITGETERSFSSDPNIATISPLHTMEKMRQALMPIVRSVFIELKDKNKSVSVIPDVRFRPINLMSMNLFYVGLEKLYESGNLSREDYDSAYGFDFREQMEKRALEADVMTELGVDPVAPSNVPGANNPTQNNTGDNDAT